MASLLERSAFRFVEPAANSRDLGESAEAWAVDGSVEAAGGPPRGLAGGSWLGFAFSRRVRRSAALTAGRRGRCDRRLALGNRRFASRLSCRLGPRRGFCGALATLCCELVAGVLVAGVLADGVLAGLSATATGSRCLRGFACGRLRSRLAPSSLPGAPVLPLWVRAWANARRRPSARLP